MREHPIPQDLTGYRFHIVGNMTLKQFVEVAAGVVVGVVLYNTNLIPIVKWPLIFLTFTIGAALAWLPIEDRPLDHWVTTFLAILYKPTKFFWRKNPKIPQPFLFKPRENLEIIPDDVDLTPARQARIREYISSVNETTGLDPWEDEQAEKIKQLLAVFETVKVADVSATPHLEKPVLGIRVRNLQRASSEPTVDSIVEPPAAPILPSEEFSPASPPVLNPTASLAIADEPEEVTYQPEPTSEIANQAGIQTDAQPQKQPEDEVAAASSQNPGFGFVAEAQQEIIQPTVPNQNLSQRPEALKSYEDFNADGSQNSAELETVAQKPNFVTNQNISSLIAPAEHAITNTSLPFPTTPTQPNKVVGMVLDNNQKIVANAIVEIKNLQGLVARAVKSNALGQFFITTPLESGTYIISADKSGLTFTQQQLSLDNQIVPPIQLTAASPQSDAVALGG